MQKLFLSFLLFSFTALSGIIIETEHFSELEQYITPKTLVLVDIDDTLLIPVQTLGTDVWFLERHQRYKDKGLSAYEALDRALAEWEAVRHLTNVKIVEEGSAEIIYNLQQKGYTLMGFTTQGLALATRTINQLHSLQIDLQKTAPYPEDLYFMNGQGVLYRKGVLFTSGSKKGSALLKLLDIINLKPDKVVFINDKATHLNDVGDAVEGVGIPFIGLRYSYSDERIQNYRPKIAEIQWERSSFGRILSDAEAEDLLKMQKTLENNP